MKNLILIFLFLMSASVIKAQTKSSDKIYWIALQKYASDLAVSHPSKVPPDSAKVIYLEKPTYIDSLPSSVNGYSIILITSTNQRKLYLEHNKILVHTQISPVRVEGAYLTITIVPYGGKMINKRHYSLSVSDGTTIYFKYDCDKKEFVFDKIKNWGI